MIIYKDNECSEYSEYIDEQNWYQYYNKVLLKKKEMNEYNCKLILMESLKRLGIPIEFVNNDIILGKIAILFQQGLNHFFPIKLDKEEFLEEGALGRYSVDRRKIKYIVDDGKKQEKFDKCVTNIFEFLKDKVVVENEKEKCKIRFCKVYLNYGPSKYISIADFDDIVAHNPNVSSIVITEIICDYQYDDISFITKEVDITAKSMDYDYTKYQTMEARINTRTDLFHSNKMEKTIESEYAGSIHEPFLSSIDNIIPNRKVIEINTKDGLASGKLEEYSDNNWQVYLVEGQEVDYVINLIDYIKWQQCSIDNEISDYAQKSLKNLDIISCDSMDLQSICEGREDYIDTLSDKQLAYYESIGLNPEDYMLNAEYQKFMGSFYEIDEKSKEGIIEKLRNQRYQAWKQKIKRY